MVHVLVSQIICTVEATMCLKDISIEFIARPIFINLKMENL